VRTADSRPPADWYFGVFKLTEPFVSNAQQSAQTLGAATASSQIAGQNFVIQPAIESEQISFGPEENEASSPDWQPDESALFPNFGVERARELLMWLINLEMRLPPYSEVKPA